VSRLGFGLLGGVVGLIVLIAALLAGASGAAGTGSGLGGSLRPGSVPAAYLPLVLSAGRTCAAAPPSILAAQLETESGWDPGARSPVGALGIAQFMPGTWARWGGDANGDGRADVHDPGDAIPAQARYDCALAGEMAAALTAGQVRGDLTELMLASYNAGPGAVRAAGGVPAFVETRNYVVRIVTRASTLTDLVGPVRPTPSTNSSERVSTSFPQVKSP
jgi:soluble lytic murein transglycosylase-like protein